MLVLFGHVICRIISVFVCDVYALATEILFYLMRQQSDSRVFF